MYTSSKIQKIFLTILLIIETFVSQSAVFLLFPETAHAAFNPQINYQGKLTTPLNVAVPDGVYNMRFALYTDPNVATTSAIWTEDRSTQIGNRITVKNGLFSVMLGSSTPLTSVNFNQTLYLGIEIGGSAAGPVWDGEMSPRKILGAVPAAFVAQSLNGATSTQFVRTDTSSTISTSSANTALTINQQGSGNVFDLQTNGSSVFTAQSNGNVGIGTSTPTQKLSVAGNIISDSIFATSTFVDSIINRFTFNNATGTAATTTNLFSITGTFTNLNFTNGVGNTLNLSGLGTFGNLLVNGSSTLQNFTAVNSTTTSATSTNIFSTTGTFTNLFGTTATLGSVSSTGLGTFANLLVNGSSTLQNFTFNNATGTAATTTNLFSTTGTFTNLFGTTATLNNLLALGSSTLQNFTFNNATGTAATTTNLFSITGTFTNLNFTNGVGNTLNLSGLGTFGNLLVNGSSTLQNFTAVNSTTTSATSTNIFSTTGTFTNLFGTNNIFTNATTTSATSTNLFSTNATLTNLFVSPHNGFLFSDSSGLVGASSSPTVGWLTATSSTATSTFVGGATFALGGGLVGIGTTTPSQLLSVAGNTYITGGLGIGKVDTVAGSLETSGLAGIGTNLFLRALLNCNNAASSLQTDGSGQVSCGTITAIGGTSAGGWTWVSTHQVQLATTTDQIIVGTSTSSPYAKLFVSSGSTGTTTLALSAVSGQSANILDIYDNSTNLSSVITGSGFLGLGTTTPKSRLAVSGGESVGADYNIAAPSNGLIVEGSTGVGTTSPSTTFSVSGNGYITGGLGVGVVNTAAGTIVVSGLGTFGNLLSLGSTTLQNFTASNSTSTSATSTNLFSTTGTFTNLFGTNNIFTNSTTTNATSTSLFSTTGTFTNLFGTNNIFGNSTTTAATSTNVFSTTGTFTNLFGTNNTFTNSTSTNLAVTGSFYTPLTLGSVPFIGGNGLLTQNNSQFFWDNTNNRLGIGTSSPSRLLHLNSASGVSSAIQFDINNVQGAVIGVDKGSNILSSTVNGDLAIKATNNIAFGTNGDNTRLYISSGGNVGIGTTSPQAKLEVVNTSSGGTANQLYLSNLASATSTASQLSFRTNDLVQGTTTSAISGILTQNFNTGKGNLIFSTLNSGILTEAMRIMDNGRVGIGTNNPQYLLQVSGSANVNTGISATDGTRTTLLTASNSANSQASVGTVSSHDFTFMSGNAEVMRITTGLNVGIGVTNPSSFIPAGVGLVVGSTTATRNSLTLLGNVTTNDNPFADLSFYNNTNRVAVIQGQRSGADSSGALYFYTATSGSLTLAQTINNVGNVGIGTTSAYTRLGVAGTVVADNFIGTTTATSTFGGPVQSTLLNITSSSATSTFGDSIALSNGCYWVNNSCLGSLGSLKLRWSDLVDPATGLTLNMATSSTLFNWTTNTGANNLFGLTTDSSANGTGSLLFVQTGSGSTVKPLHVIAGTTEALSVDTNGNVGVGTTTGPGKLNIYSPINGIGAGGDPSFAGTVRILDSGGDVGQVGGLEFKSSNAGSGTGWRITNPDIGGNTDNLFFQSRVGSTSWTDALTFRGSNGYVSIGTTTPTSRLTVWGVDTSASTRSFEVANSASTTLFSVSNGGITSLINLLATGSSTLQNFTATNATTTGLGIGSLTGPLQALNGVVTASSTLSVAYGGTGANNFAYGVLMSTGGTSALTASSGPTFAFFNATSTTATSTISTGGFTVGSNQLAVVSSTGNVGIGTAAPIAKLDVGGQIRSFGGSADGSATGQGILINDTGWGNNAGLWKIVSGNTTTRLDFYVNTAAAGDFSTNNIPLTLLSGGNVGIGTTSPAEALTVDGSIQFGRTSSLAGGSANLYASGRLGLYTSGVLPLSQYQFIQPATGKAFAIWNANSNIVAAFGQTGSDANTNIYLGGNVGVGTTSPQTKLEVVNTSSGATADQLYLSNLASATSTASRLDFRTNDLLNGTTTSAITGILTQNFNIGKGNLIFSTLRSGILTEAARIMDTGNFGIGTTSPSTTLSISGNTYTSGGEGIGAVNTNAGTLVVSGLGTFGNLLSLGSTTLQSFTATQSTTTNATSTNIFSTTGTFTNLFTTTFNTTNLISTNSTSTNATSTNLAVSGSLYTPLTLGSIPFIGGNGLLTQNNSQLFWDNTNTLLGVGTGTPYAKVSITATGSGNDTALAVANNSNTSLFTVLGNGNVGIGTTSPALGKLNIVGGSGVIGLAVDTPDTGILLSSFNSSASGHPEELRISHNLGAVDISNRRGALYLQTAGGSLNTGIATTSPGSKLSVAGNMSIGVDYGVAAPSNGLIVEGNTSIATTTQTTTFSVGGTGYFRDSLRIGTVGLTSNALDVMNSGGSLFNFMSSATSVPIQTFTKTPLGQVVGGGTENLPPMIGMLQTNLATIANKLAGSAGLDLVGTRSIADTISTRSAVANGDFLGAIKFVGDDGNNLRTYGAYVAGIVNTTDQSVTTGFVPTELRLLTNTGSPITFFSSSTERMRVASNGNVGIGSTTPSYLLSVNGTAAFGQSRGEQIFIRGTTNQSISFNRDPNTGTMTDSNSYGYNWVHVPSSVAGTDNLALNLYNPSGGSIGNLITASSNGNVGISTTTPQSRLAISGGASIGADYNIAAPSNGLIVEGNVDIATTSSPTYNLNIATNNNGTPGLTIIGNSVNSTLSSQQLTLNSAYGATTGSSISGVSGILTYNSSANGHVWQVAGTTYMTMTSGGNVGIGTTTPGAPLTVSDSSANTVPGTNNVLTLDNTNGVNGNVFAGLAFRRPNNNGNIFTLATIEGVDGDAGINPTGAENGYLRFVTRTAGTLTEKMRVSANGNVGIGTTSPYSLLSISNAVTTAVNTPLFTIASTTAGTATSTLVTVLANGNVGIGNSTPLSALDILGSGTSAQLRVRTASNGSFQLSALNSNEVDMFTTNASDLALGTNGATNMIIKSGGNVGIGTTSPLVKLDINSTSGGATADQLYLSNYSSATSTASRLDFRTNDITTGGTTTSAITGILTQNFNGGNGNLAFSTLNNGVLTEAMRIMNQGTLGIGSTSPSTNYALDVSGSAYITNNLVVGGTETIQNENITNATTTNATSTNLAVTGSLYTPLTLGSVPFIGGNGLLTQNNSQLFWDSTNNRLGVGTSSPQSNLYIEGSTPTLTINNNSASQTGTIAFKSQAGVTNAILSSNSSSGEVRFGGATANFFPTFYSNGTEAMRITTAGSVGIGSTSPFAVLSVNGTPGGATPLLDIASSTSGFSTSTALYVGSNGFVGIGTAAPTASLDVRNTAGTEALIADTGASQTTIGFGGLRLKRNDNAAAYGTLGFSSSGITADNNLKFTNVSNSSIFSAATNATFITLNQFSQSIGVSSWQLVNSSQTGLSFNQPNIGVAVGGIDDKLLSFTGTASSSSAMIVRGLHTTLTDNSFANTADTLIGLSVDVSGGTNVGANRYAGILLGGNVGIGTSSPQARLEVNNTSSGATADQLYLSNYASATSTADRLSFRTNDITTGGTTTSAITGILTQNFNTGKGNLVFSTLNSGILTEAARFNDTGQLGIGTTSPTKTLTVHGDIYLDNILYVGTNSLINATDVISARSTGNGPVSFTFSNSNSGSSANTDINLGNNSSNSDGQIVLNSSNNTSLGGARSLNIYANNGAITLGTGGGEAVRITSGGSVGIGTTSPQAKLEVVNTSSGVTTNAVYLSNLASATSTAVQEVYRTNDLLNGTSTAAVTGILTQNFNGGKGNLAFSTLNAGTLTEAMRINDYGSIGIGNTSNLVASYQGNTFSNSGYKFLSVYNPLGNRGSVLELGANAANTGIGNFAGALSFVTNSGGFKELASIYGFADSSQTNGAMAFTTLSSGSNATERMRISSTGNIGIGTTSPAWALQISTSSAPQLVLSDKNGGVNQKHGFLAFEGGSLYVGTSSDAFATTTSFTIDQNGKVILTSALQFPAVANIIGGSSNGLSVRNSGNSRDNLALADNGQQLKWNDGTQILQFSNDGTAATGGDMTSSLQLWTMNTGTGSLGIVTDNTARRLVLGYSTTGDGKYWEALGVSAVAGSGGPTGVLSLMKSGGSVGIGTTTPTGLFSISNSVNTAANTPLFTIASTTGGTATSTFVTVLANGNVGIGTTSPQQSLQVDGSNPLRLERANNGSYDFGLSGLMNGSSLDLLITPNQVSSGIAFRTENSSGSVINALGIDRNGNIGIGTTSPAAKFDVYANSGGGNGDVIIDSDSFSPYIGTRYNNPFRIMTNNTIRATFDTAGNFGVGTSTPAGKLDVFVNGGVNEDVIMNSDSSGAYIGTRYNDNFKLIANNATQAAALATGGLGIGTTSTRFTGIPLTTDSGSSSYDVVINSTSGRGAGIAFNQSNIDSGFVGIEGKWLGSSASNMALVGAGARGIDFYVNSNTTPSEVITTAGNVGIGTTTPVEKLDVAGLIRARGTNTAIRLGEIDTTDQYELVANMNSSNVQDDSSKPSWGIKFNVTTAGDFFDIARKAAGAGGTIASLLRVNSSGNVGINTTTPSSRLDLSAQSSSGANILTFSGMPSSANTIVQVIRDNGTAGWRLRAAGGNQEQFTVTDSSNNIKFSVNTSTGVASSSLLTISGLGNGSTQCLQIDGAGNTSGTGSACASGLWLRTGTNTYLANQGDNVGVGTSTPTAKFTVQGIAGDTNPWIFAVASSTNGTATTTQFVVTAGGNVGIGTTNPGAPLEVNNSNSTIAQFIRPSAGPLIKLGADSSSNYADWFYNFANNYAAFGVGGAGSLVINSSGNVGIGTTSPQGPLQVSYGSNVPVIIGDLNTSDATGGLYVQGANDGSSGGLVDISRSNITFNPVNSTNFIKMQEATNSSLGYLGLGSDDFQIITGITNAGSSNTSGTPRLTVKNGGNVGIGTTSPNAKLEVNISSGNEIARFTGVDATNGGYTAYRDGAAAATRGFVGYGPTLFTGMGISDFGLRSQGSLDFATNGGATQMYINTSGNVGIGTTTPNDRLHIYSGASGGTPYQSLGLTVENSGRSIIQLLSPNANDSYVMFGSPAAANRGYIGYTNSTNANPDQMTFSTSKSFNLTGGNVGISTTTPLSNLSIVSTSGGQLPTSGTLPTNSILSLKSSANNALFEGVDTGSPFGGWLQVADVTGLGTTYPLLLNPRGGGIGVGTTSPSSNYASDISGSEYVTSNLNVGGTITGNLPFNYLTTPTAATTINMSNFGQVMNWTTGSGSNNLLTLSTDATVNGTGYLLLVAPGTNASVKPFHVLAGTNEAIAVDSNGNTGFGTTSPASKVDVAGTRPLFTISDTSAGINQKHWFMSSEGGNFYMGTTSDEYATSSIAALSVLSNGNVGIGTSTPTSLATTGNRLMFTVNGNISTYDTSGNNTSGRFFAGNTGSASAPAYSFLNAPDSGFYWITTNRIAMVPGNSQIAAEFEVNVNSADERRMRFYGASNPYSVPQIAHNNDLTSGILLSTSSAGNTTIVSEGNPIMTVNTVGVGIGSTSPGFKLSVVGTTSVQDIIPQSNLTYSLGTSLNRFSTEWVGTSNIGTSTWSISTGSNGRLTFNNQANSAGTETVSLATNGNVGIGNTAPSFNLDIAGNERVSQGTINTNPIFASYSPGNAISFNGSTSSPISSDNPVAATSLTKLDANHVVAGFIWQDSGGATADRAVLVAGMIVGTNITWGSPITIDPSGITLGSSVQGGISVATLDSSHIVAAYIDPVNARLGVVVCSITGVALTCGTNNSPTGTIGTGQRVAVTGLDSTHFAVSYNDNSLRGRVVVGVTNGATTISSYGAIITNIGPSGGGTAFDYPAIKALTSTKFVLAYASSTGGTVSGGSAIIGDVSGGTTITFGATTTFNTTTSVANNTKWISLDAVGTTGFIASFSDVVANTPGAIIAATYSGNAITFGTKTYFVASPNAIQHTSISMLDSSNFVIGYSLNSGVSFNVTGTVSGTTVTTNTPTQYSVGTSQFNSVTQLNSFTFINFYYGPGGPSGSGIPLAIVGNVPVNSTTYVSSNTLTSTSSPNFSDNPLEATSITKLDSNHVVATFIWDNLPGSGLDDPVIVAGLIVGTNITWGTPVALVENIPPGSTVQGGISVTAMDANHVVVAAPNPNLTTISVQACSITGITVSCGSNNSPAGTSANGLKLAVTSLDSTHFALAYNDSGGKGRVVVGVTDGNKTISSYGAIITNIVTTANGFDYPAIKALTSTKFVMAYASTTGSVAGASAIIGDVSGGTTITFGATTTLNAPNNTSNDTKWISLDAVGSTGFIATFQDTLSSSGSGAAIAATYSGNAITFGSKTYFVNSASAVQHTSITMLDGANFEIGYNIGGSSSSNVSGTVSGTAITFGTPVQYSSTISQFNSIAQLSSTSFINFYYGVVAAAGANGSPVALIGTFSTDSTLQKALVITNSGNVGIGTANPTNAFQVTITASGNVASFTNSSGTCSINPTNTSLSCSSDERLKNNIQTIASSTDIIRKLRGVTFNWRNDDTAATHIGFIAQEVQAVAPELVTQNDDGYLAVNYLDFAPILVNAWNALDVRVSNLESIATTTLPATTTPMLSVTDKGLGIGTLTPNFALHAKFEGDGVAVFENDNGICEINPSTGSFGCAPSGNVIVATSTIGTNVGSSTDIIRKLHGVKLSLMSASTTVQQFGFAADDVAAIAPELVDNVGGIKLVRTSDLIPLLVNSVNDLATKVDSLDTRVSKLEATLASTTSATTTPGVATAGTTDTNFIVNTVLGAFQNMGTQISQGMAHFTSVFADNIVIGSQEKPAGITLYDIATHLPYCLRIENGGQVTAPGTCADTISAGVAQAPSNVTITSTSTTTPTGVATTGSGSTATSTPSTFSNNTSNTSGTTTATTGSASTTATTGTASTTASASTATDSSVSSSASTTPTG